MDREEIIATLRAHADELRRQGVRHAALFGSAARGDARPDSDIDILVELDPQAPIGVFAYAGLKRQIAALFPGQVDVVNRNALKIPIRPSVLADAIYAF